jgi:hypothetical protein
MPDRDSKSTISEVTHPFALLRNKDSSTPEQMAELLAEDVAFYSPLLVRPAIGRALVAKIFSTSSNVRRGQYIKEYQLDERTIFLWWQGTIEGHDLETFEVVISNQDGLIVERRAGYRPYPAVTLFRKAMYENFKDLLPPDVWDYSSQPSAKRQLRPDTALPALIGSYRLDCGLRLLPAQNDVSLLHGGDLFFRNA